MKGNFKVLSNLLLTNNVKLDFARAGRVAYVDGRSALPKPQAAKLPKLISIENTVVNTASYLTGIVVGKSAVPTGLNDRDLYLAKPVFRNKFDVGDIVLIKISSEYDTEDKRIDPLDLDRIKIRVVTNINKKLGTLEALTFNDKGVEVPSRGHKIDDVVGIIKYRIPSENAIYKRHIAPFVSAETEINTPS